MNKYEALRLCAYERLEFTGTSGTTSTGHWREAFITYKPEPWRQPITEDVWVRLTADAVEILTETR